MWFEEGWDEAEVRVQFHTDGYFSGDWEERKPAPLMAEMPESPKVRNRLMPDLSKILAEMPDLSKVLAPMPDFSKILGEMAPMPDFSKILGEMAPMPNLSKILGEMAPMPSLSKILSEVQPPVLLN